MPRKKKHMIKINYTNDMDYDEGWYWEELRQDFIEEVRIKITMKWSGYWKNKNNNNILF